MRLRLTCIVVSHLLLAKCALVAADEARQPATTSAASDAAVPEPARILLVPDRPQTLKVVRVRTGHLLVWTRVNDRDAGWFILDTGAGMNCIDAALAKKLELPEAGQTEAKGTGGKMATRFRRYRSLEFGPVDLEDGAFVELNLAPYVLALGQPIAGVIGCESFRAGVFDIDFESGAVSVHDASNYHLPASAQWSAFSFESRRPIVTGQIEDFEPGPYLLDTGDNHGVIVYSPTVKKLGLLNQRKLQVGVVGGVGGMNLSKSGKLERFRLLNQSIDGITATFSQATEGLTAKESLQGQVGLTALARMRLITNYSSQKLALISLPEAAATSQPTTKP